MFNSDPFIANDPFRIFPRLFPSKIDRELAEFERQEARRDEIFQDRKLHELDTVVSERKYGDEKLTQAEKEELRIRNEQIESSKRTRERKKQEKIIRDTKKTELLTLMNELHPKLLKLHELLFEKDYTTTIDFKSYIHSSIHGYITFLKGPDFKLTTEQIEEELNKYKKQSIILDEIIPEIEPDPLNYLKNNIEELKNIFKVFSIYPTIFEPVNKRRLQDNSFIIQIRNPKYASILDQRNPESQKQEEQTKALVQETASANSIQERRNSSYQPNKQQREPETRRHSSYTKPRRTEVVSSPFVRKGGDLQRLYNNYYSLFYGK
jgi:hypothetical protein